MADLKLKQVLESAVNSGKFGKQVVFVDVVPKCVQGEDHFASAVIFATVKLGGRCDKSVDVVVKRQQKDPFVREMMSTDIQFYNEALMYNEILPFLNKDEIVESIYPNFIYGRGTLGDDVESDILIVEDLRQYDYRLTEEKLFIDFDHCALALKKLGEFHALSYSRKQDNFDEFISTVSKLKEHRWDKEFEAKEESNRFLNSTIRRGVSPLLEAGENVQELEAFLEKTRDTNQFMQSICRPEEPVAVLCHGDFCRNNMVFRYDAAGKPTDVRFFDVATSRYASPAIDLAFFLFLNTSRELRAAHWDDLLEVYHSALSSTVPGCRVPPLEVIRLELSRRAAYGYVLCSFFIPMMMDTEKVDFENLASMQPEEIEERNRNIGGELATRHVTDIVRDLLKLHSL